MVKNIKNSQDIGENIYSLCQRLWPITRSITGEGVRQTLGVIKEHLPGLIINEVPTGEVCFDWEVPKEWNISDAYVICPDGNKILDFKLNNLHVVSYSIPIDQIISLGELQKHLHSLSDQPEAIPYITSYYEERWGFCLSETQRNELKEGDYRVYIDSTLSNGSLTYGELIIRGRSTKEIFLSTYVCHPSMANNELSGPTVTTYLAKWIESQPREYTYRIIFIPETIGAICYLSKNIDQMKRNIIAGFNISCVGDNNSYSYLPSRQEDTIADKVALQVLKYTQPDFIKYSYLDRGSDERQYCAPGVDLPIASVMRTKYHTYPEYHTSLDDLNFISPEGLYGAYDILTKCIFCLENNKTYKATVLCEPQMGKRKLWPTLGGVKTKEASVKNMMDVFVYADGDNDLLMIAKKLDVSMIELQPVIDILLTEELIIAI